MVCSCKSNVAFAGRKYNGAVVEMGIFLSNLRLEMRIDAHNHPARGIQNKMPLSSERGVLIIKAVGLPKRVHIA